MSGFELMPDSRAPPYAGEDTVAEKLVSILLREQTGVFCRSILLWEQLERAVGKLLCRGIP